MRPKQLDDVALVSPFWLVLRALRAPLIIVILGCVFVERYGVPTIIPAYRMGPGGTRAVASFRLEFRRLDEPAIVAAIDWIFGEGTVGRI